MLWFKNKKEEKTYKWQFFVLSHTNEGYRINERCEPIWDTPKNLTKYFLGTYTQALLKSQEMTQIWMQKFGSLPLDLRVQRYVHIPDFEDSDKSLSIAS